MKKQLDLQPILIVDDDQDDCEMTEKALRKNDVTNPVQFLSNGEELIHYLRCQGKYSEQASAPWPCLILLDLNMPKMDGRRTLELIKSDKGLKNIPVVIMTTSHAEEDIHGTYSLGANSFISKALDFEGLNSIAQSLKKYWLEVVELPVPCDRRPRG